MALGSFRDSGPVSMRIDSGEPDVINPAQLPLPTATVREP